MSEKELLPCPFCGKLETVRYCTSDEYDDNDEGNEIYFAVVCDASIGYLPEPPGGCGAQSGYMPDKDSAAEKWNTRAEAA